MRKNRVDADRRRFLRTTAGFAGAGLAARMGDALGAVSATAAWAGGWLDPTRKAEAMIRQGLHAVDEFERFLAIEAAGEGAPKMFRDDLEGILPQAGERVRPWIYESLFLGVLPGSAKPEATNWSEAERILERACRDPLGHADEVLPPSIWNLPIRDRFLDLLRTHRGEKAAERARKWCADRETSERRKPIPRAPAAIKESLAELLRGEEFLDIPRFRRLDSPALREAIPELRVLARRVSEHFASWPDGEIFAAEIHGVLARHGERQSLRYLVRLLDHENLSVRYSAASEVVRCREAFFPGRAA